MEVDGRAARAGAADKAAADRRTATRARRRRIAGLAVVVAVVVVVAALVVVVDRTWFGPPSLAAGTRHTATLRLVPSGCPGFPSPEIDFAGRHWWPAGTPRFALPATGTLTIVRSVGADEQPPPGRTATFVANGTAVDLFGGSRRFAKVTTCPIS